MSKGIGRMLLALLAAAVLLVSGLASVCAAAEEALPEAEVQPHTRPDGGKYRLAYIDYDEYLPSSRQLCYILQGLEEKGWISEGSIPFTIAEINAKELTVDILYQRLVEADLGPYIAFAEGAFHFLGYEESDVIAQDLQSRAGTEIDLVITFGTSAGVFVKSLNLPIPMVDFSATDPVASGIIDSATEGSGNPNVWAQVEPAVPRRQLKYYYSLKPFSRLGVIVYGDETISGVPDIRVCAEELGFELVLYHIDEVDRETDEQLEAYYAMVEDHIARMTEEGIDAFFLTADLINHPQRLRKMLDPFYEKKIPVYLLDDATYVELGGLMLIAAYDNENVGRFVADAITRILSGAKAGSLPCVYTSAPSIYFNYDIARLIGYPIKFDFLVACDTIYTAGGEK